MKLSKNLLQAMTVGLAIGAAASVTSCSLLTEDAEVKPQTEQARKADTCEGTGVRDYECGPCGMG